MLDVMLIESFGFRRAFSTLVADSQFSTLGVVLIAVLARVGRLVGLPEPESEPEVLAMNVDVKMLLTSSVRETGREAGEIVVREYVEDMGEVVERRVEREESRVTTNLMRSSASKESAAAEDVADQPDNSGIDELRHKPNVVNKRAAQTEKESNKSQSRSKKRCKKGNTIDDIFDDLI